MSEEDANVRRDIAQLCNMFSLFCAKPLLTYTQESTGKIILQWIKVKLAVHGISEQNGIRDACSTADCCPLLSIAVHCCPLLSIVVHCCPSLSVVVHCCPLLSIVFNCYPLLSIVIQCCPLLSIVLSLKLFECCSVWSDWITVVFWGNSLVKLIIADISQCFPYNLQQFHNVLQRYYLKAKFLMIQFWICSHSAKMLLYIQAKMLKSYKWMDGIGYGYGNLWKHLF